MFKCGFCGKSSRPGERATRVVTETREKIYPFRPGVNPIKIDGKRELRNDPGGRGTEIVSEVLAHHACATAPVK